MNGADRLCRRRWRIAGCVFDEANWTLVGDGRRVYPEAKPLEVLRELLLKAGQVVTKNELLDRIWPDVHVVEASLPTAIGKLRRALGDESHDIIETVSGIGYRIPVQVDLDDGSPKPEAMESAASHYAAVHALAAPAPPSSMVARAMLVAAGVAIGLAALILAISPAQDVEAAKTKPVFSQAEAANALRKLDIAAIDKMVAEGWDPNTRFDTVGTDALDYLLNMCEWDRGHDQRKMLLMARTLLDAGDRFDDRNVFGDTAYSIAKAPRYCGPDHPVTQMLEAMCYSGPMGPKDLCLATYELTAEQRKAQGLPAKG